VLQASIDEYLRTQAKPSETDIPTLKNLAETTQNLKVRAENILAKIGNITKAEITIAESIATTGGGTMPTSQVPSVAISLKPTGISLNKLSKSLRLGSPAIVGYTDSATFCLDLRTIFPWQDDTVVAALSALL